MFENTNEQDIVAHFAQADSRLMQELAATHGLEFAATFRIEFANEVAKAHWAIIKNEADKQSANAPSRFDDSNRHPGDIRSNQAKSGRDRLLQSVRRMLTLRIQIKSS